MHRYLRAVTFDVAADAYGAFMGRFSEPLAVELVGSADARPSDVAAPAWCLRARV